MFYKIYDSFKAECFFRLPWSLFFNITTMSAFAPVIEMSEFLNTGTRQIEQVYILQHFKDTFTSGNFEDRMALEPCQEELPYERYTHTHYNTSSLISTTQ